MSAVFDASVVVKWFVDDPLTSAAKAARLAFQPAIAPDLVMIEVANALRRYVVQGDLERDAARDNLAVALEALEIADHVPMVDEAFGLACRFNHSATDCLYVVLARRLGLPLISADQKMARKFADLDGLDLRLLGADPE